MLHRAVLIALFPFCVLAATPDDAILRQLWSQLERAEKLAEAKDAAAIPALEDIERRLQEPDGIVLARDNFFGAEIRSAVYILLAKMHAGAGHIAPAQKYLKSLSAIGCWSDCLSAMKKEKPFDAPEFKPILDDLRRRSSFWDGKALNTPYRENISVEEKIAGLSKFWSEVKYNFIFVDQLLKVDWDSEYLTAIPKVMATASTIEYYHVLEELCAKLRDGHTNIFLPRGVATQGIPINTQLIDGHVIVTKVYTHELADDGIRVGQEVLELDGKPVLKRAAEDAVPYVAASTDLARERAAYDFYLTRGTSKSLRIRLQDPSGAISEHTINRGGYKWDLAPKRERVESKVMGGNIGYIAINDCGNGQEERIDEAMPKLMNTAALIVDLRRNGGGSSGVGYHMLGYLTDRPFAGSRQVVRHYIPTYRARGMEMELVEMPADEIQPHRKALYAKPVVVLTSAGTASAAEDFCVSFKTIGRGKFIGEATNGSTGQPLMFSLPGGGSARVCTKHDTFPDGSEFVGVGVLPDIPVHQSIPDLRAGVDTVLGAALHYLEGTLGIRAGE